MIHGLIPAAGLSTRMGRSKLELPFRGKSLLETVIDNLLRGGCDRVTVVLGPQAAEWVARLASANVDAFTLDVQTPDMRATVESGLARIESRFSVSNRRAFLLCPADCPTASSTIVAELVARFRAGANSVLVPNFNGRRGHPVLFSWQQIATIRALPSGSGINVFFQQFPGEITDVFVGDPGVLGDVDTPEEYEKLIQRS